MKEKLMAQVSILERAAKDEAVEFNLDEARADLELANLYKEDVNATETYIRKNEANPDSVHGSGIRICPQNGKA
jgi:hypothetical protein